MADQTATKKPGSPVAPRHPRATLFLSVFIDVVVPLLLFYGLRQQGVSVIVASLVSGVVPALRTVYSIRKDRKVDVVALFMVSTLVLGGVLALVSGNARLMFAKDGWITGLFGLWLLITLAMSRPFFLHAGKNIALTKVGEQGAAEWEQRWATEPRFRHGLRLLTVVWGLGLIADAVIRMVIAYTVDLDSVPLITNIQYVVVIGLLVTFMMRCTKKYDLRA